MRHNNLNLGLSKFPPTPRATSDLDYKGDLEFATLLPSNVANHFQKYKYQAQHDRSELSQQEEQHTMADEGHGELPLRNLKLLAYLSPSPGHAWIQAELCEPALS